MKPLRCIQKHYPITTSSLQSQSGSQFALKAIGQSWVQFHDESSLCDVVSLPEELRMAKLYLQVPSQGGMDQDSLVYLFNCQRRLWLGTANQMRTQLEGNWMETEKPMNDEILITNGVVTRDNLVCYLTLNTHNKSHLNILANSRRPNICHSQLSIPIAPYSNLTYSPANQDLFYINNHLSQQNIIHYNMQKQAIVNQLQLTDIQSQNNTQTLPLTANLLCLHNSQYLALLDTRTNSLLTLQPIYPSQSATTTITATTTTPNIYYTKQSSIYTYNIRKGATERMPAVVHGENIVRISGGCVGESVGGLFVEDWGFCGIWLYA